MNWLARDSLGVALLGLSTSSRRSLLAAGALLLLLVGPGKSLDDGLALGGVVVIPGLETVGVHEVGPAPVRLDDFALGLGKNGLCFGRVGFGVSGRV